MSSVTLPVTDLTTLDVPTVQNQLAVIAEMVQEANPTVDPKRGVLYDLLFYNEALLATATQTNIDLYLAARSLLEITDNPALATPAIVDSVLSFFRITRLPGSTAAGQITVVTNSQAEFTIPYGATFAANGQTFTTTDVFTMHDDPALVITPEDRYLLPLTGGTFSCQIPVVATTAGAAGNLTKNTVLTPSETYATFVTAYAASDFSGGADVETNAQLLDRLLSGVASQSLSNRLTMEALLQNQPQFASVLGMSIIGMGDAEMRRDQHGLWPSGGGGRVDWYVRTQQLIQSTTITPTATLVSITDGQTSVWQFGIGRDDAPAFYDVTQILLTTAASAMGSYEITSCVRSFDLTNLAVAPDIVNAAEAAYTRYQTAVLQFIDTDTPTAGLTPSVSQQPYNVTVTSMPGIDVIQDFMLGRQVKAAAYDVLVKAPVPCVLSLSLTVYRRLTDPAPNTAAIAQALAVAVNTWGFAGVLPASLLSETVQALLTGNSSCSAIDMFGLIRRPDGVIVPIRSSERLLIPQQPDTMTSSRTVGFFLDPTNVAIAVQVVNLPEV